MMDLFQKLILPILSYCCDVWGFICANTFERVNALFIYLPSNLSYGVTPGDTQKLAAEDR